MRIRLLQDIRYTVFISYDSCDTIHEITDVAQFINLVTIHKVSYSLMRMNDFSLCCLLKQIILYVRFIFEISRLIALTYLYYCLVRFAKSN